MKNLVRCYAGRRMKLRSHSSASIFKWAHGRTIISSPSVYSSSRPHFKRPTYSSVVDIFRVVANGEVELRGCGMGVTLYPVRRITAY